ncbi:CxC2 domain-containing protein [Mycena sanguinolenta]|uniref:CxC2 domain-containing protein n=1 Tax=Mycena sanguinolenta TaxID=230812 RepID=A0A8H7DJX8_9AGAR|nr:CxC2 domain-containing protein [Mycena sanguinolenta]
MSTCTGLAALDHANTKYSQGYAATGCGMITCGRHEIVAKNGVADLQAGEKYGNMDYVVASAWRHFVGLLFFLLSYDIMCQWSKKLKERLKKLPPTLRLQLALFFVKFVIPKLHILGHLKLCQETFSLLFTLGTGQADMEGIKRIWSSSGLMGASTRGDGGQGRARIPWTTSGITGIGIRWSVWVGNTLWTRFLKARKELATQKSALDLFSKAQKADVPTWQKEVDDFEAEVPDAKNPYELSKSGVTLRDIELELLNEEQDHERQSGDVTGIDEETMTGYLMLGLEIEGQQHQLRADIASNKSPTTKDLTDFVTRRTRISRQIRKLRALQCLATHPDPVDPPEAERAPLFLPSSLLPAKRTPPAARASTSSDTASRTPVCTSLVDTQQRKVDLAAGTYRRARTARLALIDIAGPSGWQKLEKADLRLPEDEEEAKRRKQRAMKGKQKKAAELNENGEVRGVPGMGEKTRLISWIWLTVGRGDGVLGEEVHTAVKVEWCKAYARVKRWREEFLLLQEEMVRCLRTLEWQAKLWDQRATPAHYTGKVAYAPTHLVATELLGLGCRPRSASSGIEDQDIEADSSSDGGGGDGADDLNVVAGEEDGEDDEVAHADGTMIPCPDDPEEATDSEEEEGRPVSREAVAERMAEMDELLAIQSASTTQYDGI